MSDSEQRRWASADAAWRDPTQVVAWDRAAGGVDSRLLESRVRGDWWAVLERLDACLVVSREYEHLLIALSPTGAGAQQSFISLPHPSGLHFDHGTERLHVASTRNPNQLYEFGVAPGSTPDCAGAASTTGRGTLTPRQASFFPGRLYLHDIAMIGGVLHGNAVGLNAVVRFTAASSYEVAWWPRSIEREGLPDFSRNYLQLNSIAAGDDLSTSFFSASAEAPSARRPGHRNFPVDRRGVIFSGARDEPIARGLTRPHSARLHGGQVWVNDSGYGRVVIAHDGALETVAQLPGWTRGLTFAGDVAFVGTSRVLPRYANYAPGLDAKRSTCAVHALDSTTGELLGSITWPAGNQIFGIAVLPRSTTLGFPTLAGRRQSRRALSAFYFSYQTPNHQEHRE